ncbi:penicillin-binding protein 2 [Candidatus Shapirobacteria bacterium]|nr:penicillin-binding protein 2 [Candidatus Shapirobacteria bacterium]
MERRESEFNLIFFKLALVFSFLILVFRLFQLQVISGKRNRELAEGNRTKIEILPALRGVIYDRQKRVLARNVPVYKKCRINNEQCTIIGREEALRLEAEGKAGEVVTEIGREYPYGEILAHVIGYLGEANEKEILNGKCKLKPSDLVGRTGVEAQYDCLLRGKDGGKIVEVDANGNKVKEIGEMQAVPGQDLTLTLDASLQKAAYEALGDQKGAVVVTNPRTGEILALVSSPSFNPAIFESCQAVRLPSCQAELEKILADQNQPLFNRAISGTYPPGSTFKIITAVAGLEEGKIDRNFKYDDPGVIVIGPYRFANWYYLSRGAKEGLISVVTAMQRSTDTFFYKVGEMVGLPSLAGWSKKFGLGQTLGIDLPAESEGFVPDEAWKKRAKGESWFLGNTYHLAIGQGDLLVTPLQVNSWTAAIANGGKLCQPHLSDLGDLSNLCQDLGLKRETVELVREGLRRACEPASEGRKAGTGWPFFDFKVPVGCKTGTAEFGDPQNRTHAWFTIFAPSYASDSEASEGKPEIVVTVLVEGGGEGSNVAAPIAKKILEEWFGH